MKVTINQKAAERILKGHLWIFRSDLVDVETEQAGDAAVCSQNGKVVGHGLYSPESLIALRLMTEGDEKITDKLIRNRISDSVKFRERIFPGNSIYRAVFAEGDRLPSLIIDRYDDVLVFQTLSAGMEVFKDSIVQSLREIFRPRSIVERNDAVIRRREGLPLLRQVVHGEDVAEAVITLNGRRYGFSPLDGQKTGFFLDQRFNAIRAASYLEGGLLDCFSYVGQFAIQAAAKASRLECVDASEPALEQIKRNARLNEIENLETIHQNAFDYLKLCDQEKRRFDGVTLDPPAFVKGRSSLPAALRGYKEINLRAMRILNPGGVLVTSSCSQNLKTEEFEKVLRAAAKDARRSIQVLEKLGQPADHPWLLGMPETHYLKCYILKIL